MPSIPSNVSWSLATALPSTPSGVISSTNLGARPEPNQPANNGATVWYSYTPPNSGSYYISTIADSSFGGNFLNPARTFLNVYYYDGTPPSASVSTLTEVSYSVPITNRQQAYAGANLGSQLAWEVMSNDIINGTIFYIRVDGALTHGLTAFTTVQAGGSYTVGDVVYPNGGNGIVATLAVDSVNGSEGITSMEILTPGAYSVLPPVNSNSFSSSVGTGSGSLHNIAFSSIASQGDYYLSWGNFVEPFLGTCNGDQPVFDEFIKCMGNVTIPNFSAPSSSTSFGSFPVGIYKMQYSRGAGIVHEGIDNVGQYAVNSVWFIPGQTVTGGTIGPWVGLSINDHNLDPSLEPDIQHFDYPPQPSDGFGVTHFYNSQAQAEKLNRCYSTMFTQSIAGDISLQYYSGYSITTPASNFMLDNPGGFFPQDNPAYGGAYTGQGAGDICNPLTPISGSTCTYIVAQTLGFIAPAQCLDNGDNNPSYGLYRYLPNIKFDMGCVFWASIDNLGNPTVPAPAGTSFTMNCRLNNLSPDITWPSFTASLSGAGITDAILYGSLDALPPGDFNIRFVGSASSADTTANIVLSCPYWDTPLTYTYYLGPIYNKLALGTGLTATSQICSSSLDTGSHKINNVTCTWTNQGYWNVNPSASYTLTTAQGNPFILAQNGFGPPYDCHPITSDAPFFTEVFNCVDCFCYSVPAHITTPYNPTVTQSLTLHIASNIFHTPTTCSIHLFDGTLGLIDSTFGVQLLN